MSAILAWNSRSPRGSADRNNSPITGGKSLADVAPRAGARIETFSMHPDDAGCVVAPRAGARIETRS